MICPREAKNLGLTKIVNILSLIDTFTVFEFVYLFKFVWLEQKKLIALFPK